MVKTLQFEPGNFAVLDGIESVRARVVQRLHFARGEWFLDQSKGIPYVQALLGRGSSPELIGQELAYAVTQVEGVVRVVSQRVTVGTGRNTLDIELEIETDFGRTELGVTLGAGN